MTTVAGRRVNALGLMAADIKLAHSVFALPFAILGAFLAGPTSAGPMSAWWRFGWQLVLVVACMVLARTWAMLVNRLADHAMDAANPRTMARVFASGTLRTHIGWLAAALCGVGFCACAWLFQVFFHNPWPAYLAAPVLAWLAFYSLTKRFTMLCHVVLGVSLALSPLAAALAVRPASITTTPCLWWLAAFVMLWVAGFDIIYALQDEDFDRDRGLASIPAALGTRPAIWAARALHVIAMAALLAAWTSHRRLGPIFASSIAIVAMLLVIEHATLAISSRRTGLRPSLHMAFFTLNGIVSCIVGIAGCVDLLV